jgi:hypothetical protein
VKKYLFHIFDKVGISSRVELVLYAVSHGDPLQAGMLAAMGVSAADLKNSTPGAHSLD